MQPEGLPAEADYFDRLYDTKLSEHGMALDYDTPYKDAIFGVILKALSKRLPPGRRTLLDVGTHVGRMLQLATAAGFDASGIELNPTVAEYAARRTGRPVIQLNAFELTQTGRQYDAVLMTDVLEHIPRPKAILADLYTLVRPDGWIAVKVPCGANQLRKQRFRVRVGSAESLTIATSLVHVNHFTPSSLKKVLTDAGFRNVTVTAGAPEFSPLLWSLKSVFDTLAKKVVYRLARLPGGVRTPLALNLQAYGQK